MKRKTSTAETISIIFLILLLIAVLWYFLFYKPTTEEIADIKSQTEKVQSNIQVSAAKVGKMNDMQKEIDAIFEGKQPEEISEIAPFDNKENVMNQLNDILAVTTQYSLSFSTSEAKDGMVRRKVNVNFTCDNYETAKQIILALENNHWRCIINTLNINTNGNSIVPSAEDPNLPDPTVTTSDMNISASITFFESKNLTVE